jgi:hypothetical protein
VFDSALQIGLSLCLFAGIVMGISNLPLEMWLRLLGLGIILLPIGVLVWHYVLDAEERHQIVGLVRLVSAR